MPLYRMSDHDTFVPFEKTPFADLERVLETWIETNPHLLVAGETFAIIARQPRTTAGKYLDLLGIDRSGSCVVIELKRGETPRDVVAQALEYAAWVDTQTTEQLDDLARAYAATRDLDFSDVGGAWRGAYLEEADQPTDGTDAEPVSAVEPSTYNTRQRIVIVAEQFSPEVSETLRYLRTKLGVDVTGVQFGIHRVGDETIVETEIVVGRERQAAVRDKVAAPASGEVQSDEMILARVQTDFMRRAVTAIEEWVQQLGRSDVTIGRGHRSDHDVRWQGKVVLHYYYARKWLFCRLFAPTPEEVAQLRTGLSKPEALLEKEEPRHYVHFHMTADEDLSLVEALIAHRLRSAD